MNKLVFAACAASSAIALAAPVSAEVGGARIEAIGGWEHTRLDSFGSRNDPGESAVAYGLGAGYDLRLAPSLAIGVDVEASESTTRFHEDAGGGTRATLTLGRDLYAGGRITAAVTPSLNLYAKAGYTNVRVTRDLLTPVFAEIIESNEDGVRLGAGAQLAVGPNLYVGAEYRYSGYDGEIVRHQTVAALGVRF